MAKIKFLNFTFKNDVIPESLKNMLLVMDTTGLFNISSSDIKICQLRDVTKDRIDSFLPGLWEDLFKERKMNLEEQNSRKEESKENYQEQIEYLSKPNEIPKEIQDEILKNATLLSEENGLEQVRLYIS